ncbi:HNH endonuclease [Clostridium peptidivorans]|uniref:HNH endonuclease n=1 Tax=Clostridium peptidivorans TaxID=100174 RepID=UPI000BE2DC52|nr:HNH endonuclease [Clostridium peptidivorans]
MAIYRKCTQCGKKVLEGTLCQCEVKNRKEKYKEYKHRRLQDNAEKERQKFYSSNIWLTLSENIKKHYFGLCVVCWFKGLIQENEYTHHIETIKDRFDLRLEEANLIPLCDCCHKKVHRLMDKSKKDKVGIQKFLKKLMKKFNDEFY